MIFNSFHIVNVNSSNDLVISREWLASRCRKETFIGRIEVNERYNTEE